VLTDTSLTVVNAGSSLHFWTTDLAAYVGTMRQPVCGQSVPLPRPRLALVSVLSAVAFVSCASEASTTASDTSSSTSVAAATTLLGTTSSPAVSITVPLTTVLPTTLPPTSVAATTSPPETTGAPASGSIKDVDFDNFTYEVGLETLREVTTVDGQFFVDGDDRLSYNVLDVDYADLDGDGVLEAGVTTVFNTGGTGNFSDVLIYRWTGSTAEFVTASGIGDRADGGVAGVSAGDGALTIERNTDSQGACCPGAIESVDYQLDGDTLVAVSKPRKRGIIDLVNVEPDAVVEIKFLKGTSSATLFGATTLGGKAILKASEGQALTLTIDEPYPGDAIVFIDIELNGTTLGSAKSGETITITLPESATYDFVATDIDDTGDSVFYTATLTIE
jgi:hypothetical protein